MTDNGKPYKIGGFVTLFLIWVFGPAGFGLLAAAVYQAAVKTNISAAAILFVFGALCAWGCVYGIGLSALRIYLTDEGIMRRDGKKKSVMIRWENIGSLEERPWMQQLVIHGKAGAGRIAADYQLEEFDYLRRVISEKMTKKKYIDSYPASYGRAAHRFFGLYLLAAAAAGGAAVFAAHVAAPEGSKLVAYAAAALFFIFAVCYVVIRFWGSGLVIVDRNGFVLRQGRREQAYSYDDTAFMDYDELVTTNNGVQMRSQDIVITLNDGAKLNVPGNRKKLPEIYGALRQASGKKSSSEVSDEILKELTAVDVESF